MIKYGFTQEVADTVDMPYFIMKDIKSEPEEKDIEKYVEILKREEPDAIIAIGGGSVIDTAKASLYHYKKAKLVAIPSTSGSGSEVTMAAVLAKNGVKYSLVADYIAPIIAILDSRLPEKCLQNSSPILVWMLLLTQLNHMFRIQPLLFHKHSP
ncbi:MAG: iron-containing alcohol dehydrogenase [Thermoplasmata archaeon]|nr:iron-containing alcohol dehydrogenase [Thermoplasmata archaeon]